MPPVRAAAGCVQWLYPPFVVLGAAAAVVWWKEVLATVLGAAVAGSAAGRAAWRGGAGGAELPWAGWK